MKKIIGLFLAALFLLAPLAAPVSAAGEFRFTLQPQNLQYPDGAVAIYSAKVDGAPGTPSATWYMLFEGKTYNISQPDGSQPWEGYAGELYGPRSPEKGTFLYVFQGIGKELNGAEIWCVAEDGHNDIESAHAIVTVSEGAAMPPEISVPAAVRLSQGEEYDLRCVAKAPAENVQLTYTWYETATGKLPEIKALPEESEFSDSIAVDTSKPGTRYYVCGVFTSAGGIGYSSVIPVTVSESAPAQELAITTKTLPDAVAGKAYKARLEANDSAAQFSEYYNPGAKNDLSSLGLTLAADGTLSGTPSKAGTFEFSVCAANAQGEAYATFTLKVTEAGSEPATSEPTTGEPATAEPATGEGGVITVGAKDATGTVTESSVLPLWVIILICVGSALIGGCVAVIVVLLIRRRK